MVQMDSFRSTVVVTLSVNVMCTHLYYCSMRCLYCNTVLIRNTIPQNRTPNAGDRTRTYVLCGYAQLRAVVSTIIYIKFL